MTKPHQSARQSLCERKILPAGRVEQECCDDRLQVYRAIERGNALADAERDADALWTTEGRSPCAWVGAFAPRFGAWAPV